MFGSAFLLPSDCSTTSIWVAIATHKALVLSVLNLEKVVWQGGFGLRLSATNSAVLPCGSGPGSRNRYDDTLFPHDERRR